MDDLDVEVQCSAMSVCVSRMPPYHAAGSPFLLEFLPYLILPFATGIEPDVFASIDGASF